MNITPEVLAALDAQGYDVTKREPVVKTMGNIKEGDCYYYFESYGNEYAYRGGISDREAVIAHKAVRNKDDADKLLAHLELIRKLTVISIEIQPVELGEDKSYFSAFKGFEGGWRVLNCYVEWPVTNSLTPRRLSKETAQKLCDIANEEGW